MGVRRCLGIAASVIAAVAIPLAVAEPAAAHHRTDRTPPSQPTNVRAVEVTQTSVTLAWNPSTDNVGVMNYEVSIEGRPGVIYAWPPETSLTWGLLKPGETVMFRVTAVDARYNESPPSAPLTVTLLPPSPPSGPSGLTVEQVTASTVLLKWNSAHDPADDPEGLATHEVLVNGVPTANSISTLAPGTFLEVPSQGAWVRQLEPSTTYQFSVRGFDTSGDLLGTSNTVSATTGPSSDTVAPTTPVLLRASDGGTSFCPEEMRLAWTQSTDDVDGPSAVEYEVRINGRINDVLPYFSSVVIYTDVWGANTVTIVAVDKAGNASAPSNAKTVNIQWGAGCSL